MKTRYFILLAGAVLVNMACEPAEPAGDMSHIKNPVETVTVELPAFVESEHPYANGQDREWLIEAPREAQSIILPFDSVELEWGYDFLKIYDGQDNLVDSLTGTLTDPVVELAGNVARIRLVTDSSVVRYGVVLSRYKFTKLVEQYSDHRPVCANIGSYGESWVWADTGELIKTGQCGAQPEPQCVAIGSRSEGWVSGDNLIVWDRDCHRTIRLALVGENCGPSIGFSCHDNLYCQGVPQNTHGGTGTCLEMGHCVSEADCSAEGNEFPVPACMGHATCEDGRCGWVCDGAPVEQWGWVSHMVRDLESEHPYADNTSQTFSQQFPGATKFKLFFQKIELEAGYDHLSMWGVEEMALELPENSGQFWTDEFNGDTAFVHLDSDYSVRAYGFAVSHVSFWAPIPPNTCAEDGHCAAAERCEPNHCFNPYAPCYGRCVPRQGGELGDVCDDSRSCETTLFCKNVQDGAGRCEPELWCDSQTRDEDCANVIHPAVPGLWTCLNHTCSWQTTVPVQTEFENTDAQDIPDDQPAGIESALYVDRLPQCQLQLHLDVHISHSYQGDLVLGLTEPGGQRVVLHSRAGGSTDDLNLDGVEFPVPFTKEGTFILDVSDHAAWDTGVLHDWALHFSCRD